jgi:hypothetical protein
MDLTDCVLTRKSIRAYKATPVPRDLLARILDEARHSPSCANTQPWEFAVFGGAVMEEMRKTYRERFLTGGAANPEVPYPFMAWPEPYRSRRMELSKTQYEFLGIDPDDSKKVQEFWLKGFTFSVRQTASSSLLPIHYRPGPYWMSAWFFNRSCSWPTITAWVPALSCKW